MARVLISSLCLFLFLFNFSIAHHESEQQQHRLRAKTSCSIQQLKAREPSHRFEHEAGSTELWNPNNQEFECAGVEFVRHTIQPKGLLLPFYTNTPQLVYIIQGSGIQGTVIPGCAETYESGSRSSSDRHQKLRRFRQGDVLALQSGVAQWAYNDGDTPVISISIRDVANEANQLDLNFRKFFLAGNPQSSRSQGRRQEEQEQQQEKRNIFSGFGHDFLAQALNIDPEIARKMQGREDNRGEIVRAERLNLVLPEWGRQEQERQEQEQRRQEERQQGQEQEQQKERQEQEQQRQEQEQQRQEQEQQRQEQEQEQQRQEQEQQRQEQEPEQEQEQQRQEGGEYNNGLEETLCSANIRQNIDNPSKADVYNPRAGRVTRLNSQKLPILNNLRLSVDRGVLYKNAMMAPHWSVNAHTVNYVTRGSARIQVVGNQGNTVFDEELREGQLLVVPQNFAVVKRASEQGFEWIAFRTNDNAMIGQLAGRLSAIRAMPEEVLMNAYGVSRKDARSLKYNREETTLLSPVSRSA